jgi:hypothetical protein
MMEIITTLPWTNPLELRQGCIYSELKPCGLNAVDGELVKEELNDKNYQCTTIEASRSLLDMLSVDGKLSLGNSFVGGSMRLKFAEQHKENDRRWTRYSRCKIRNLRAYLRYPELTKDSLRVIETVGKDEFKRLFGTHFVTGQVFGAELMSFFSFETARREDHKNLSIEMEAHFGPWSCSTGWTDESRKVLQGVKVSYMVQKRFNGWIEESESLDNIDKVMKVMSVTLEQEKMFDTAAVKSNDCNLYILSPYEFLPNFPR